MIDGADFLIALCVSTLALGPLLVWRERWNIPGYAQLGFVLSAVVIPIFVLGVTEGYLDVKGLYVRILAAGTAAFVVGVLLAGRLLRERRRRPLRLSFTDLPDDVFTAVTTRRALVVCSLGVLVLFASYGAMGFVPVLAEDPYQAKFFRGPYHDPYRAVAVPFRAAFNVLAAAIPVALAAWLVTKRHSLLFLSGAGVVGLLATLSRGPARVGLLLFLGLVAASRRNVPLYVVVVVLAFPLAAALYFLLGVVAGREAFLELTSSALRAVTVADVSDHLGFLREYLVRGELTYGRTFWGGLIPWHYEWNPGVWTLSIVAPETPVREVVSGGLRLPAPIWGFVSFGWPGVVGVSAVSGFVWGAAARLASRHVGRGSLLHSAVPLVLYTTLGVQLASFYFLSIHNLPGIAVALYFSLILRSRGDRPAEDPGASLVARSRGFW